MNVLRYYIIGFLSAGLVSAAIRGVVFDDRNGNGIRDGGEPGIAGVAVSNGDEVALTDGEGRYELPSRAGAMVFVVKPAGWRLPPTPQNLPKFYARLSGAAEAASADFPLVRAAEPDNFRALLFTDTQPTSPVEVGYFDRTIVDGLAGRAIDLSGRVFTAAEAFR